MSENALIAVSENEKLLPAALSKRYKVAKQVTRDVLRQQDGIPFFVEFETPAVLSAEIPGSKLPPPMVSDAINLETGELVIVIMNSVLLSELERAFPDAGYVGRKFAIVCNKPPRKNSREDDDRRYSLYKILELIEDDGIVKSAGTGVIDATTSEAISHAKKKNGRSAEATT